MITMSGANRNRTQRLRLTESLRSRLCPACAGRKHSGKPLCFRCVLRLSRPTSAALLGGGGAAYESAFSAALSELGCRVPAWPDQPPDQLGHHHFDAGPGRLLSGGR